MVNALDYLKSGDFVCDVLIAVGFLLVGIIASQAVED